MFFAITSTWPMYCTYVLYLCTIPMYFTYVLYLCTVPMYYIYVLYLCTIPMYCTYVLYLCTVPISHYKRPDNTATKLTSKLQYGGLLIYIYIYIYIYAVGSINVDPLNIFNVWRCIFRPYLYSIPRLHIDA